MLVNIVGEVGPGQVELLGCDVDAADAGALGPPEAARLAAEACAQFAYARISGECVGVSFWFIKRVPHIGIIFKNNK